MSEEKETLDAEVQDDSTVDEVENNDNLEEEQSSEPSDDSEDEAKDEAYINQKKRAEKAEAELKKLKAQKEEETPKKQVPQQTQKAEALPEKPSTRQETIVTSKLLDEGLSPSEVDEHLDELYYISERENVSLVDAAESRRYTSFKDAFQEEKKAKAAQMPASKGSGVSKKAKDFNTPDLDPKEHKAMWEKQRRG